jgi:hypothetical protein
LINDISKAIDLNKNKVENKIYSQPTPQDELYSLHIKKQDFLAYWEEYCRRKALEQSLEFKISNHVCQNCKYEISTNVCDIYI